MNLFKVSFNFAFLFKNEKKRSPSWQKSEVKNPIRKIEKLISDRNKARKEKKFPEADKIRNKLALDGIILEDSPSGTKWRINN